MSHRPTLHQPRRIAPYTRLARVALLSLLVACASTGPRADAGERRPLPSGPRDAITEAEIARIAATDAYDVVRKLRGNFLASRGLTTFWRTDGGASPQVFVDGMHVGSLAELRGIPANTIHEVRFVSASDATVRYGIGYAAGVIQVTTKR